MLTITAACTSATETAPPAASATAAGSSSAPAATVTAPSTAPAVTAASPAAPGPEPTPVGHTGQWVLLFHDEFEGESLDPGRWTTCYWWDRQGCTNAGNNELEWYLPDNALVRDGSLHLRAERRTLEASDGKTYGFVSGMVTTGRSTSDETAPPRFAFRYGYAEIRARLPRGRGLWPAFWMLPASHESKPEIDILEVIGSDPQTVHMTYHFAAVAGGAENAGSEWRGADFSDSWHTFGVDWSPEEIVWYVDGVERWRYADEDRLPDEPMYLLANLAVGGDWPGPPDSGTVFPSTYEIDYIRVWSRGMPDPLGAVADAAVSSEAPTDNFGSEQTLYVDGDPVRAAYLRFDTAPFAGRTLTAALLRIKTTSDSSAGSGSTQQVRLVEDAGWSESGITSEDQPAAAGAVLGSLTRTFPNTSVGIPLDAAQLQPLLGGLISLALQADGDDGLYFYSRESASGRPQLILTFAPESGTPAP